MSDNFKTSNIILYHTNRNSTPRETVTWLQQQGAFKNCPDLLFVVIIPVFFPFPERTLQLFIISRPSVTHLVAYTIVNTIQWIVSEEKLKNDDFYPTFLYIFVSRTQIIAYTLFFASTVTLIHQTKSNSDTDFLIFPFWSSLNHDYSTKTAKESQEKRSHSIHGKQIDSESDSSAL